MLTRRFFASTSAATGYASAVLAVASITALIAAFGGRSHVANISMVYLVGVIALAVRFGQGPAILASLGAFFAFDFFFVRPVYTFTVSEPSEWIALLLFLMTAIVTGQLAAQQQRRANEAIAREREAALLYDVARALNNLEPRAALRSVAERLRSELGFAAAVIEIDAVGTLAKATVAVGESEALRAVRSGILTPVDVLKEGPAPSDAPGKPGRWVRTVPPYKHRVRDGEQYRPQLVAIRTQERRYGVLAVVPDPERGRSNPAEARILAAAASQIASAIDRERLRQEATETEALRRTDELKSALLNAVSHDLRTPLASIIAAAGSLQQTEIDWTSTERKEFAEAIEQEAVRLNRLVGNLLDLSRIESGSLQPDKGWFDLNALIDEVVGRLKPITAGHSISVDVEPGLPPVELDYIEIDEVLTNLLENAVRYTPPGSEIHVGARREGNEVLIEVADRGPGLPPDALERIFESFYRVAGSGKKGTGLGLAVARGLVEAHGGRIWAANRPGGGAVFSFTLPLEAAPAVPPTMAQAAAL